MKHSRKERKPKGYSHGRDNNYRRTGPIMIEDIMDEEADHSNRDITVREMTTRTEPTNPNSPTIKNKFKPLNNPSKLITVLQGILIIKKGCSGNNVTTGPLQYAFWRGCLKGTALARFNMYAAQEGNETLPNLILVERKLVTFFAPREVLRSQTRYMRTLMRKPRDVSTRQYVGAVTTLNETLAEMPPSFDATQKIPDNDIRDILASKAPQSHKDLMTEHGYDPRTGTMDDFLEYCERAETKEAKRRPKYGESDHDDSDDERHLKKKAKSKPKYKETRMEFFCKSHGPNSSHDSKDCKVLNSKDDNWKKKPKNLEKYKDYKAKYQKKHAELNMLQMETKKERAATKKEKEKWIKAHKKLQAKDGEHSESESSKRSDASNRKPEVHDVESSSSSSSDSESG